MTALVVYLLQGAGLGLAAAAQPGPFQAYLISQSLERGWRRTMPAALAPVISDGPIIILAVLLLSQIPVWFQRLLYLAGGLFVVYLAISALRVWKKYNTLVVAPASRQRTSLLRAAMMNALSPGPYLYWGLVTGPILVRSWRESAGIAAGFLAGFYIAMVGSLALIIIVSSAGRRFGPQVNRALLGVSALALLVFGLYQIWTGLTPAP